ncbi:MAG: hypothetical protein ACTSXQ_08055 [Alphaproteobacteria bacterium]
MSKNEFRDINVNIQSFIFNVSGCLDNLAWILHEEKNMGLGKFGIGLFKKEFQKRISDSLKEYLISRSDWHRDYLKVFRDTLAHGIPFYIPPANFTKEDTTQFNKIESKKISVFEEMDVIRQGHFEVDKKIIDINSKEVELRKLMAQQDALGKACTVLSSSEKDMRFHPQIISDFRTVIEMFDKVMEELLSPPFSLAGEGQGEG